jgi:hypothetical protein
MKISKHAIARTRQRGIKADLLDIIVSEGVKERLPGGAMGYFLRKSDKRRLMTEYKRKIQMLDHVNEVQVVESVDGMILTVYRRR